MLIRHQRMRACSLLTTFLISSLWLISCNTNNTPTLFRQLPANKTGIDFINQVVENDSINPLDLEFLYNGGGVAVGDFNRDGKPDLYFTASTISNKLYLNKGDLNFADITDQAGVTGNGSWSNAASVVDINNDGLLDIYVCTSIKKNPEHRKNLLYVNQGVNGEGIPLFKEMAREYLLDDTSMSVHAAFFDYDNDGDLDLYLVNTKLAQRDASQFTLNRNAASLEKDDFDKLYRNDWDSSRNHPVFTDVSADAGIQHPGYGLGVAITDINHDGWKDIYVTNDFYGSDLFYINNRNGTFSEKAKTLLKHTSQNAMGNDIADINNDGLPDILAVDMNPEDNFRKKKNMNGNNYFIYQNMTNGLYMLQYVRNTLQLNQGPSVLENDSLGDPVFSEISFLTGMAETDWSWNASIADFDNDGQRDVIITNGYPRDVTDHDFAAFQRLSNKKATKQELIDQMPQIKISNYAFKNKGNLQFEKVSAAWGLSTPSFSNGAVYADLDNDGDLDYVINNINETAFVYENSSNTPDKTTKNYLTLQFKGDASNPEGIGTIATIYYDNGKLQTYENAPYRGYLSTVDTKAFFGLDSIVVVDSIRVEWPTGKVQVLKQVKVNQQLLVNSEDARLPIDQPKPIATGTLFTEISTSAGISYHHREMDFIDFNEQRLLPHKLSEYGPALASGDVDGNGWDDILISGTGDYAPVLLKQLPNGTFSSSLLPLPTGKDARRPESLGALLLDADSDGDLDLYLCSGSNEFAAGTRNYQDWFFINDGKGNFSFAESGFPENYTSKSCVKAADFDQDGDLDLFIGGRVHPKKYPYPVSSFIYRNDSKKGAVQFSDVSKEVAPFLTDLGLVCDAIWTDFNNDGWQDLIVVGEWMAIRFFKNNNGILKDVSAGSGISKELGWWNSITGGDFDNDGDIDYVVGNLGKNAFYRASPKYPVRIYAKDFDGNKSTDIITTVYLPDEQGELKEFPAQTRDDQTEQLPGLKKRFLTYKEFGKATFQDIFRSSELNNALQLEATNFNSSYLENLGGGQFKLHSLPLQAQFAPVYGMVVNDFNADGWLDIALSGNDFGTEVGNGRYDALNGLVLLGDGAGQFKPQSIVESGLYIPGNGKALIECRSSKGNTLLVASQNRGPLKVYRSNSNKKLIPLSTTDQYCLISLRNGKKRKMEIYHGNSFLSQSANFIPVDSNMVQMEVISLKGEKRVLTDL